jgi:hypothetical protein
MVIPVVELGLIHNARQQTQSYIFRVQTTVIGDLPTPRWQTLSTVSPSYLILGLHWGRCSLQVHWWDTIDPAIMVRIWSCVQTTQSIPSYSPIVHWTRPSRRRIVLLLRNGNTSGIIWGCIRLQRFNGGFGASCWVLDVNEEQEQSANRCFISHFREVLVTWGAHQSMAYTIHKANFHSDTTLANALFGTSILFPY